LLFSNYSTVDVEELYAWLGTAAPLPFFEREQEGEAFVCIMSLTSRSPLLKRGEAKL
jgi:hypothetical protein